MRISVAKARAVVVAVLLVPFLVMTSCATTSEADSKVSVVGPREAVALIHEGNHVVIDLRSEEAFEAARVAGAVNVPFPREGFLDSLGDLDLDLDRDAAVLVYAQDPKDAARVADLMAGRGFTAVVDGGGFGLLALARVELGDGESD